MCSESWIIIESTYGEQAVATATFALGAILLFEVTASTASLLEFPSNIYRIVFSDAVYIELYFLTRFYITAQKIPLEWCRTRVGLTFL